MWLVATISDSTENISIITERFLDGAATYHGFYKVSSLWQGKATLTASTPTNIPSLLNLKTAKATYYLVAGFLCCLRKELLVRHAFVTVLTHLCGPFKTRVKHCLLQKSLLISQRKINHSLLCFQAPFPQFLLSCYGYLFIKLTLP